MATVNFLYRSTKQNANLIVRLLHRHNDNDIVIGAKTKYLIEKDYWNKHHKKTRLKDIDLINKQVEVNAELNKIENHILKAFNLVNISEISKEWLQNQIDYYYNPPIDEIKLSDKLIEYATYYLSFKKDKVGARTYVKLKIGIDKLIDFEATQNKTYLIKDVNEAFLEEFKEYYLQRGYAINTIKKDLIIVKSICRHARNKDIETSKELDSLTIKKEDKEKIYLTLDELEQIEQTQFESEALSNAKDWLIISCYCGQRVSDFLRFTKDMLRIENDITLIEFKQQKTGKLMELPLHPKIVEILKKNNGNFPYKISDQRYNEYIKDVCKIAGITQKVKGSKMNSVTNRKETGLFPKYELISSHVGRRSFATNNYGKIPTAFLISITGHSSEEMFLEYIGKTQNEQAKGIVKYW
ncbi:MAG: phage integrase SAM-like domain-containing protein [Flavobacteriales bacterium]